MIIRDVITVSPDLTIGEAMAILKAKGVHYVPVVGGDGKFMGIFGVKQVFQSMLPASARIKGGLDNIDFMIGHEREAAQKLKEMAAKKVSEVMQKDCARAKNDEPMWESVRLLAVHGSPIPVVDETSGKLLGLISNQSVVAAMDKVING